MHRTIYAAILDNSSLNDNPLVASRRTIRCWKRKVFAKAKFMQRCLPNDRATRISCHAEVVVPALSGIAMCWFTLRFKPYEVIATREIKFMIARVLIIHDLFKRSVYVGVESTLLRS